MSEITNNVIVFTQNIQRSGESVNNYSALKQSFDDELHGDLL